jgi:hypothetical protein
LSIPRNRQIPRRARHRRFQKRRLISSAESTPK